MKEFSFVKSSKYGFMLLDKKWFQKRLSPKIGKFTMNEYA